METGSSDIYRMAIRDVYLCVLYVDKTVTTKTTPEKDPADMSVEELQTAICIFQTELQYKLLGCPKKRVSMNNPILDEIPDATIE